ncbi:MAG TPA: septum formation initiator family protein [Arthrobacter sp.]
MATRRPKVPRAASRRPATTEQSEAPGTGDVIRADFGGSKENPEREKAGTPKGSPGRRDHAAKGNAGTGNEAAAGKGSRSGGSQARGGGAGEDTHPVPAKAFSGRMLALAVVMIAITIMLAPTVKIFFDKKAEIDALNADIAASQAKQDSLKQQISRWQDPNYVKQQARDRINMVMPGETGYWVFGSDLPAGTSSGQPGAAAQDPADLPWVDSLWESIRRAATD